MVLDGIINGLKSPNEEGVWASGSDGPPEGAGGSTSSSLGSYCAHLPGGAGGYCSRVKYCDLISVFGSFLPQFWW